ncbi:MAG: membrane protein insertion efficiency factor YidD [Proteobacteria bacterium]|nr:membrane protein insertion efficiency factor YidD [Pseudomonadota bacterium]
MSSPSLPASRWPSLGLLGLIQLYKWTLSPLIGNACRYKPTCSSYAAEAIRRHGAWAGSWMAGARICRCAPWGGSGWDPAPASVKTNSWWRPWRYGDWKGPKNSNNDAAVLPREGEVARAEARDGGVDAKPSEFGAAPSVALARDSSPYRGSSGLEQ